jgi:phosphatidylserine decarboxylase precursor
MTLNFQIENSLKIKNINLFTEGLKSSIVYEIYKVDVNVNEFEISFVDINSIKRFNLKNDNIDLIVEIADIDINIPLTISVLNLIQLTTAGIKKISKAFSDYSININFQVLDNKSNDPNYLNDLSLFLTKFDDTTKFSELNSDSTESELNSIALNQSSLSLSSISNPTSNLNSNLNSISNSNSNSRKSISKFLPPKLYNKHKKDLQFNSNSNSSLDLSSNPDMYHDDTDGFLILQIESATGLPPFRNSTHLGYDMDPFVVVSFSKQIFKTAVCRHALNPSWKNQLINIRVSKYSFNFKVKLSVYDFDLFTFNDDICSTTIEINNLINESEYNPNDSWTYKKLPLTFSNKSLSKKMIKLNDYFPELSIRFKYVSVNSLSMLIKDFNPTKTKCPYCNKIDKRHSSALQHLSICKLNLKPTQFLHKSYATSNNASRRWYVKILAHVAYGRLTIGGNNAHMLVQDRETGLVLEEKISAFVKLGIRLLYKSVKSDNSSEKIKRMLRILSIKQGKRYDAVDSKSKIKGFVKFHGLELTLNECLKPDLDSYKTFNEFFSRKLKPTARPLEGGTNNDIIVSMADSRLIVFNNISNAKDLWIKGNGFTIDKLLGKQKMDSSSQDDSNFSIAIFRLAPQDYHRVHVPLNGKIIKIYEIHGSYYTVNPMAVRSALDVFGENVRTVITLETEEYGNVEVILVGAMMVGSIIVSVKLNEYVKKGQELGYFKFGGSTAILIFKNNKIEWDADLISNSNKKLETLVKVGMSVGHSKKVEQYHRGFKKEVTESERREVIRRVTGLGDGYGVGMSENFKAKLGGMFDDVISLKSKRSFGGNGQMIDTVIDNDWEVQELTTLDGLNDNEENLNVVDIALAQELRETRLYQVIDSDETADM